MRESVCRSRPSGLECSSCCIRCASSSIMGSRFNWNCPKRTSGCFWTPCAAIRRSSCGLTSCRPRGNSPRRFWMPGSRGRCRLFPITLPALGVRPKPIACLRAARRAGESHNDGFPPGDPVCDGCQKARNAMSDRASAKTAADAALDLIQNGFVVGLGTGRAALSFVAALAKRVQDGLEVRGVPTSQATAEFASSRGIPLVALNDVEAIDVAVDGADEVDPQLNLIKGLGGALLREKIVAAASRRLVIVIGPDKTSEKVVPRLGTRGVVPVEVVPFGLPFCQRKIVTLGCLPEAR